MAKSRLSPDYIEWVLKLNANEASREMHKINEQNKELARQTEATRKAMAQLEAEGKKGSKEWQNLNKSIKENNATVKENKEKLKELDQRLDLNQRSAADLSKKLKDLRQEFRHTSKAIEPERYRQLKSEIDRTQKALKNATTDTNALGRAFQSLTKMKTVLQGFFMGIGAQMLMHVVQSFKDGVNVIIDFEKENSKLAGILQSTKKDIQDLTAEAQRLGATTAYTASEVTKLQIELAKLGFGKDQIKQMEDSVLKFALAVDTDLANASQVAGGALRAFGLDASQTESALATLAIGTTTSALSFNDYATMLSTVAPVAKAFGFTIEDTVALMGALKNANFDASSAATATRNILLNLADSNGALAKALGAPVTNLDDLATGLKKLQQEGIDLATALDLTDKRSVAAFETFINNADTLRNLRAGVTNCTDAFNAMYKEMGDNVQGSINILKSTFEGLILQFYNSKGAFKLLIDAFTEILKVISKLAGFLNDHAKTIMAGVAAWVAYKLIIIAVTQYKQIYIAVTAKAKAATDALNASLKKNIWGVILTVIAMVVAEIIRYIDKTKEAARETTALQKATNRANQEIDAQRAKIQALCAVITNENAANSVRINAINELKKIIPGYNAQLSEEGRLIGHNTQLIQDYITQLERQVKLKAYQDELEELYKKQRQAKKERDQKYQYWNKARLAKAASEKSVFSDWWSPSDWFSDDSGKTEVKLRGELDDLDSNLSKINGDISELETEIANLDLSGSIFGPSGGGGGGGGGGHHTTQTAHTAPSRGGGGGSSGSQTVDRIKEINEELKTLRKTEAETDEEFFEIQERIKSLQDEKKKLMGKTGKKKPKKGKNGTEKSEPGTYGEDDIDEVTAPLDIEHQKKLLNINKRKDQLAEADFIIEKNREIIRYEKEVVAALENMAASTDASHTKTLDKIHKEQQKSELNIVKAQQQINNAKVKQDTEYYYKRLAAVKAFYDTQNDKILEAENKGELNEAQAEIYRLQQTKNYHAEVMAELQKHLDELEDADYYTAKQRATVQENLLQKMAEANRDLLQDTAAMQAKYKEMTSNPIGLEAIKNTSQLQVEATRRAYDTMIEIAKANGMATAELERQKAAKIREINYQLAEQLYGIQEKIGVSWAQQFDHELAQLQKLKDDELITEQEYQRKRLELLLGNIKKYFDYYAGSATTMFSAIQQAEIDTSEAKYDALISQAEANGEDTAALEEEKENKKLEIQKKYADVNFAIKISQIIADTAVSIMKAFADLGPIGGAIAAAMLTATGIAQVISAKAERDKIKNLQPKSGASKVQSAERVVSGYSDGGYTGDGKRLEVAGVVHRGEYVVPQPIMGDPRVVDAVNMIEAIRRQRVYQGEGGNSLPKGRGFANGGHTGGGGGELAAAASELRAATEAVKQLRAYVVYQDIEKAGEVLENARDPFTRN